MNKQEEQLLRKDAERIIKAAIRKVLPDEAVKKTLENKNFGERSIYLVAIGKAAWQMAEAAEQILLDKIEMGIVITKYGHVKNDLQKCVCYEAGHPIPDENTYKATQAVLKTIEKRRETDIILFLISGGGSALFEQSELSGEELMNITNQLLASGADIVEINTIRKRLSKVKGGKFAKLCEPAQVYSIVLSDIIGDPLDMIASGPAFPDSSTCEMALNIVEKYGLQLSERAYDLLKQETPKQLKNVETVITGSVGNLCKATAEICEELGYETFVLTDCLNCEAREAGRFLAAIAKTHYGTGKKLAFIAGGETVVHVFGKGKGGRNQELALAAAEEIDGMSKIAVFSVGSDGTDGPTDAAGGYVNGETKQKLKSQGIDIYQVLQENNAYYALEKCDGLIFTGPTGTNVNDVAVVLLQ